MWVEVIEATGEVVGSRNGEERPPSADGRLWVQTSNPADVFAERYENGVFVARPAPPKTLSKADVIGALTPAQWAEMQRYHPGATGTSPGGTPYNDPDVFWAISVFNAATKDFAIDDPRIASILGMLVQKGVLSAEDVTALQTALAAAAS